MEIKRKIIIGTLASISMVGMIGIPMGDPQFFPNANPDTVNNKNKNTVFISLDKSTSYLITANN